MRRPGREGEEMSSWYDELWNDAMETAMSDSYSWVVGTEWGAEWMLRRLDKVRADAWDEAFEATCEAHDQWGGLNYEPANPYRGDDD